MEQEYALIFTTENGREIGMVLENFDAPPKILTVEYAPIDPETREMGKREDALVKW